MSDLSHTHKRMVRPFWGASVMLLLILLMRLPLASSWGAWVGGLLAIHGAATLALRLGGGRIATRLVAWLIVLNPALICLVEPMQLAAMLWMSAFTLLLTLALLHLARDGITLSRLLLALGTLIGVVMMRPTTIWLGFLLMLIIVWAWYRAQPIAEVWLGQTLILAGVGLALGGTLALLIALGRGPWLVEMLAGLVIRAVAPREAPIWQMGDAWLWGELFIWLASGGVGFWRMARWRDLAGWGVVFLLWGMLGVLMVRFEAELWIAWIMVGMVWSGVGWMDLIEHPALRPFWSVGGLLFWALLSLGCLFWG